MPRFHTHAKGGHRSHPLQKCIPVLCSLFALPSITRCLPSSLPFRAQFYTVTCGGPSGPPAHLHSGVWRVVCFWLQRSPSPLLYTNMSANLLPRQSSPARRWARARATVPASHRTVPLANDSKRTCCYSHLESFRTFVPQVPVRWHLEVIAGHPCSCTDPGSTQWCLDRPP